MPASPPRGGGGASAGSGTPPRGASTDPRLADMPEGLSQSEVSHYIKDKCKLDDPMWAFVDAISKKGANVRWACTTRRESSGLEKGGRGRGLGLRW